MVDFSPFTHHGTAKPITDGKWMFDVTAGRAFDGSVPFTTMGDELSNTPNAIQATFMGNFDGTRYTLRAGGIDGPGSKDQGHIAYRWDTVDMRGRGVFDYDATKPNPVFTAGNQLLVKPAWGADLRTLVSSIGDKTDWSVLLGGGQNYGRADGGGFNDPTDKKILGGLGLHGAVEYTAKPSLDYTQVMARLGWTAARWQVEASYTNRQPTDGQAIETAGINAGFRLNKSTAQPARVAAGPVDTEGPSVWGLNSTAPVASLFVNGRLNLTTNAYTANALAQYAWQDGNFTGSIGHDSLKNATTWNAAAAYRILNRGDKKSDILDPFLVLGFRGTVTPLESTVTPFGAVAAKINGNTTASLEFERGQDGGPAGFFRLRTIW